MTGEELLGYVRSRVADHEMDNYTNGQRALQYYCTHTGFTWLQEVNGAAVVFQANESEYPLGDLGLRRIDHIWRQDSDSGEWVLMHEATLQSFEQHVADHISTTQLRDTTTGLTSTAGSTLSSSSLDVPNFYTLQGSNILTLRVTPTPGASVQGRIDGIANTPQIERLKELPGPSEYHILIGDIWVGYEMEHQSVLMRKEPGITQDRLLAARDLGSIGQREVATATMMLERVVRDTFPNRTGSLKWKKTALMR